MGACDSFDGSLTKGACTMAKAKRGKGKKIAFIAGALLAMGVVGSIVYSRRCVSYCECSARRDTQKAGEKPAYIGIDNVVGGVQDKPADQGAEPGAKQVEAAEQAAVEAVHEDVANEQPGSGAPCYVTPRGRKYHVSENCNSLRSAKNLATMTVEEASASGYEPCDICAS